MERADEFGQNTHQGDRQNPAFNSGRVPAPGRSSPEVEWFANIRNPSTRRAHENAIKDFMLFAGIMRPEEFRTITRAHVIALRDDLGNRTLTGTTMRHRMAALSSLFQYLCDKNAVTHNPVTGVKRPTSSCPRSRAIAASFPS
jgi:site-specific recombinase XerD